MKLQASPEPNCFVRGGLADKNANVPGHTGYGEFDILAAGLNVGLDLRALHQITGMTRLGPNGSLIWNRTRIKDQGWAVSVSGLHTCPVGKAACRDLDVCAVESLLEKMFEEQLRSGSWIRGGGWAVNKLKRQSVTGRLVESEGFTCNQLQPPSSAS